MTFVTVKPLSTDWWRISGKDPCNREYLTHALRAITPRGKKEDNVNMLRIMIVGMFLVLAGASSGFAECDDYCSAGDLDCEAIWASIHYSEHGPGDYYCANSTARFTPVAGYCSTITRTPNGTVKGSTFFSCLGRTCNLSGNILCGGSLKPYNMTCTDDRPGGGTPAAWGEFGNAGCRVLDGGGVTVSCNSSNGQLVFSNTSSTTTTIKAQEDHDATYWCANCGASCVDRFDFCRGVRGTDACMDDYFTCTGACGLTCDGLLPI